ncbi:natural cytotoxicity triggering receptor 3-like isoform X3 [Heterodontus francisci]|uniref:natural cytotoxicity triggering receptor 3-like isoform X3 n=1 Tax=Heterodontus francisci TaxID=7792 RepID=UPI00355B9805
MDSRCIVWVLILFSGIPADYTIRVIQTPSFINATEGQSVILNCTYEGPSGVGVFKWFKNTEDGAEVTDQAAEYSGRITRASADDFKGKRDASINIKDLRHYDSGKYYCKVELMGFQEQYGQGTTLNVMRKLLVEPSTEKSSESLLHFTLMYISAGALGTLILFSGCYSLTKGRGLQCQSNDWIYDDIPLAPAPEPVGLQSNIAPCSNFQFNDEAPQRQSFSSSCMDMFSNYDEINPADVPPPLERNETIYHDINQDDFPPPFQCDEEVHSDIPPNDITDMVGSGDGADFDDAVLKYFLSVMPGTEHNIPAQPQQMFYKG